MLTNRVINVSRLLGLLVALASAAMSYLQPDTAAVATPLGVAAASFSSLGGKRG